MIPLSKTLRQNALFISMGIGAAVYTLFANTPSLAQARATLSPLMTDYLPIGMFAILYFTFCKINLHELKPRTWHFAIQATRITLSLIMVALTQLLGTHSPDTKLILEGMFICIICPTAAAVVVIAEKLGCSIGSLTTFTIIANIVTMIIIPTLFPLVEKGADISFLTTMLLLLRNVIVVLVLPLFCALATKRLSPRLTAQFNSHRDIGFYIWSINRAIVTGSTLGNIHASDLSGHTLWRLLRMPRPVGLLQFALGKLIGHHWGDSISAGQALGQKNTVIGIWLTLTFLNPLAAVAPGAYVLWQNMVNALQLWYKQKYGRLKW